MKLTKLDMISGAALIAGLALALPASAATVDQERDISGFEAVSQNGSADVTVMVGESFSVVVTADDEVVDAITTEVRGNILHLGRERGTNRLFRHYDGELSIKVTMPVMKAFRTNGSGDSWVTGVEADDFEFEQNGSGDTTISGTCVSGEFEMNGSGDVDGEALVCNSAEIDTNGSGDLELTVNGEVSIDTRGSGDIDLHGNARIVSMKSRGSGEISIEN